MIIKSRIIQKALFCLIILTMIGLSSCRTKGYGCEATTKYQVEVNRKGEISNKKGKTNLFSKKKRRKMKSGKRN